MVNPDINDIILDIGCGTGKQIIELSEYIKLGIRIDISDGMVEQAIENARKENKTNVQFYTGTFDKLVEKNQPKRNTYYKNNFKLCTSSPEFTGKEEGNRKHGKYWRTSFTNNCYWRFDVL